MKININKFGIAGALTVGTWYLVFAFFAKLWPVWTVNLLTSIHLMKPLPILARYFNVSMTAFSFGLILYLIFGYLFLGMIGAIYNFIQK